MCSFRHWKVIVHRSKGFAIDTQFELVFRSEALLEPLCPSFIQSVTYSVRQSLVVVAFVLFSCNVACFCLFISLSVFLFFFKSIPYYVGLSMCLFPYLSIASFHWMMNTITSFIFPVEGEMLMALRGFWWLYMILS